MITFNDPESAEQRAQTAPLSLEQEQQAIQIINDLIWGADFYLTKDAQELLQNFVNHYQNMAHYVAYTSGLWATDQPDKIIDKEKILFQIGLK